MVDTQQLKLAPVLAALLFISFVAAGCDSKTTSSGAGDPQKDPYSNSTPSESSKKPVSKSTKPGAEATAGSTADSISLILYFGDEQSEKLVKEVRTVDATEAVARAAVDELIKGPSQGGVAVMPDGTRLLGISVNNGTADVNFSREFVDNHPGGSAAERLTVYSIVNTLTEFSTIEEVGFLVEGDKVDTIAGHMDTSQPVKREESLL